MEAGHAGGILGMSNAKTLGRQGILAVFTVEDNRKSLTGNLLGDDSPAVY